MIALLEKLKKEWHVIRAAPWSFLIVCAVTVVTIGGGFRYAYREKLADSDRRANQWKSDAEYWKDIASRKEKSEPPVAELRNNPASKPSRPINSVTNPQGSIVNQGSPNLGTQTVNNVPPSRELSKEKLEAFTAALRKSQSGTLRIVPASSADDVFPLQLQLCAAAHQAKWGSACPTSRSSVMGKEVIASGLECYSENWQSSDSIAFKEAMKIAQLRCEYIPKAYDFGGVQLLGSGGVTLVIGSPTQP